MARFSDQNFERFNDRETFALSLLTNLSDMFVALESEEATSEAISQVGRLFAQELSRTLLSQNRGERLDAREIADALVELKHRIGGGFHVVSMDAEKIVLRNTKCPFGARALGRPYLCTMTKQVFQQVAEDQAGYGHVDVNRSIARGHRDCEVVVYLSKEARQRDRAGLAAAG